MHEGSFRRRQCLSLGVRAPEVRSEPPLTIEPKPAQLLIRLKTALVGCEDRNVCFAID